MDGHVDLTESSDLRLADCAIMEHAYFESYQPFDFAYRQQVIFNVQQSCQLNRFHLMAYSDGQLFDIVDTIPRILLSVDVLIVWTNDLVKVNIDFGY